MHAKQACSVMIMEGFSFVGCFLSTAVGELRCYQNPKNKITAVPANEEEIWGATFKVIFHFQTIPIFRKVSQQSINPSLNYHF